VREKGRDRRKDDRDRVSKFSRFHLMLRQREMKDVWSLLLVRSRRRGCASVAANSDAPLKNAGANLGVDSN
jgi:hypothetical protein